MKLQLELDPSVNHCGYRVELNTAGGAQVWVQDEQGRPRNGFLRLHEVYNLKLNAVPYRWGAFILQGDWR